MWNTVVASFYSEALLIRPTFQPFHLGQAVHAFILLAVLHLEQGCGIYERNRLINPTVHMFVVVPGIAWNSVVPVIGFFTHLLVYSS